MGGGRTVGPYSISSRDTKLFRKLATSKKLTSTEIKQEQNLRCSTRTVHRVLEASKTFR